MPEKVEESCIVNSHKYEHFFRSHFIGLDKRILSV